MEKILKVKDYEIPVKSHAGILLSYKLNFRSDAIKDIAKLKNIDIVKGNLENLDIEVFYRLLWVMAKAYDESIAPLEIWLSQFDVNPVDFILETLSEVMDLLASSFQSTAKKK